MKHMTYLLFLVMMITSLSAVAGNHGDEEEGADEEVARIFN